MVATLVKRTKTPQGLRGVFTIVASGNYATNGDSLDFAPKIGYTNKQPTSVLIKGIAGYEYEYVLATKKVIVRQGAVAGTIVGTFVGTPHTHDLFLNSGDVAYSTTATVVAAANKLGPGAGADITVAGITTNTGSGGILQATDTGVVTATLTGTAAPGGQLGATSYPAGVTGDTITAIVDWTV